MKFSFVLMVIVLFSAVLVLGYLGSSPTGEATGTFEQPDTSQIQPSYDIEVLSCSLADKVKVRFRNTGDDIPSGASIKVTYLTTDGDENVIFYVRSILPKGDYITLSAFADLNSVVSNFITVEMFDVKKEIYCTE